jgi:hypothetical protein
MVFNVAVAMWVNAVGAAPVVVELARGDGPGGDGSAGRADPQRYLAAIRILEVGDVVGMELTPAFAAVSFYDRRSWVSDAARAKSVRPVERPSLVEVPSIVAEATGFGTARAETRHSV